MRSPVEQPRRDQLGQQVANVPGRVPRRDRQEALREVEGHGVRHRGVGTGLCDMTGNCVENSEDPRCPGAHVEARDQLPHGRTGRP